uniref:FA complementation group B n=1 Tax=Mastacembelus armatus TaxID=205130 RepID=A0A3Q3M048_9TELE
MEILYRNPHRLSLCGNIIVFDCKTATNDSEKSELLFCSFSFDRPDNTFLKAADGAAVISRKTAAHVDVVKCNCAVDVQKRVTVPCVLVTKKSKKGQTFQYSLLTLNSSNRLEPRVEFKLPYQMRENVSILQGPTVLWTHAGNVFYTSLKAGEVRQIPIQWCHCVVGELPLGQALGCFVENGQVFDCTMILPHPYICITRCLMVLSADKVDDVLKSSVVAATSNRQLVYFENGVVKDTCQLPFEQPEDIQMVNTGRNGCLFVISFQQGHVCAVWKETFQVSSHWSGVSSVHVDDFLGCGTDQMLLVFNDQCVTGPQLDHFFLSDLCGISYSVSHLFALSVQEGLIALWDCDDESKNEALDDRTQDMPAVSSKPQVDKLWHRFTEDRMVVGVILTTDSSDVSLSILTEMGQSSMPAVIQTQSQVFWLHAPCPSSSSSSSSSSSAFTFLEPPAKRRKPHDAGRPSDLNTCRLAVTAVTRLTPLLNSGFVKCRVMLHYIQRQDAFSLVSNPTPVFLHCGDVELDIQRDFHTELLKTPELKTDEVKEDLLSLLAALTRWIFTIDSPDHSLGDIGGWIQKRVDCKRIEVSPEYLLLNSSGSSTVMLLRWHQITPFQGELYIHSCQLQMLKFLNSLLSYLPESCSIHPVKGTRGDGAAQIFSLALEKEVTSLIEGTSTLLCEKEADEKRKSLGHDETPEPGSEDGLQRCREVWQQNVERSRIRLSPLLDVGRYREMTRSMSKVQLNGDLATLLEIQRTLLR